MGRVDHRHDQRSALTRTPRRTHHARTTHPHLPAPARARSRPLAQLEHRRPRPPPHRLRPLTRTPNGIGHLAAHLRERILYAHQLVAQINDAISECRTSSGITVDLVWRTNRDHDDPLLTRALALLRVAPQALGEG